MTSYIRKFELGGLHIESTKDATTYVGDKNDVWTDDNAPGTWRIGDGATPGGVVLFSAAGGGGGGGIALTDISVVQNPVGISGLSWNNVTGVLSYTPPDLTGYALSNSVPGDLTELGINDGTNGQVLTTDGAGTFTFTTLPSTGITYSDLSVTQNPAAGLGTLAYNNTTGTFTYTPPDLSSFGAGGADTGDFTFTNTTIGAPDQEVINIQATNADSDINSRLVLDPEYGAIKIEATGEESSRYYDSSSWGTATWANNGHGYGVVTITSASTVYDFLNAFPSGTTWSLDVTTASGTQNFAGGGYGYSFGSQTLTLNTSTTYPDPSEEVTSIRFRYTYNSYISVDYDNEIALIANDLNIDLTSTRDVNIRAGDDLQLYSNDIFTLYNDSTTVPIRIVTDNSNTSKTWAFEADGSITFPDSSSQTTAWTGTATTLDGQAPSYYLDYTNFTNTPTIPADVSDLTDTTNLLSGGGGNATTLDGQAPSYYLDYTNFTNTPTIPADVSDLTDTTNLLSGGGGGGGIALTDLSVTQNASSGTGSLAYNSTTGVFTYTPPVLFDGDYTSLTNTPTIPADVSDLTDTTNLLSSGGVALTDLSVTTAANGVASLSYDNTSGVFTFTPPDLSGYLVSGGTINVSSIEPTATTSGDGDDLTITGGDATDLNSQGGDTIITGGSGALTSGSVDIGTTQTDAITIGATGISTTIGDTLTVNGNATFESGTFEAFSTITGASGTVTHDCDNGHIFYHTSPSANFTANFTNLGLNTNYGTGITLVIDQGATARIPSAVQTDGNSRTIVWQGGSAPSGTNNGVDVVSFSILRTSGSYIVLGQLVDFA